MERLGQAFKELRESKGLKVTETAADIVSPQFLRKVERGDSNISLSNAALLLNRMNTTFEEFIYEWQGDTVDSWLREVEHELDTIGHSSNSLTFKRLISSYEKKYQETGEQRFHHLTLISKNFYNKAFKASQDIDMCDITDYLRSVEVWGKYEFFLAVYATMPFESEELFLHAKQVFRRKIDKQRVLQHQVLDFFLHVAAHFITENQLVYAEKILSMYRTGGPDKKDLYYLVFDAYAEFLEGLLLIKKHDPSGSERCQRIITFFYHTVQYTDYANRLNMIYERTLYESTQPEQ